MENIASIDLIKLKFGFYFLQNMNEKRLCQNEPNFDFDIDFFFLNICETMFISNGTYSLLSEAERRVRLLSDSLYLDIIPYEDQESKFI